MADRPAKAGMTRSVGVQRLKDSEATVLDRDSLAVEEPLEIRVVVENRGVLERHSVAITMRTPGADRELALGFLLTEGVLDSAASVRRVTQFEGDLENEPNIIEVHLTPGTEFSPEDFRRLVYTSSSCGICGRASIDRVRQRCERITSEVQVSRSILWGMPDTLRAEQRAFEESGGLHAAGLFELSGRLRTLREDVGRHNAVDKVIGWIIESGESNHEESVLLVSGRSSFELVQKAAHVGIPLLAAVGAPSSLAIELAEEVNMTIVGFLRETRCNVYSAPERVMDAVS